MSTIPLVAGMFQKADTSDMSDTSDTSDTSETLDTLGTSEVEFAESVLAKLEGYPIVLPADSFEDRSRYPAGPPYTLPKMDKPMVKPPPSDRPFTGFGPDIAISVKSMHRNPPFDVRLAKSDFKLKLHSLFDVRYALAIETGIPLAKIKVLHNKKPAPDNKLLADFAPGPDTTELEFTVMILGGAATVAAAQAEQAKKAAEEEAAEAVVAAAVAGAEAAAAKKAAEKEAAAAAAAAEKEAAAAAPPSSESPSVPTTTTAGTTPDKPAAETEVFWDDLRAFLLQRTRDEKHADELFSLFLQSYENRIQ